MNTSRLEAFSDGVLAIIITIMVLDLKIPSGTGIADLEPMLPFFVSYALSFIFIGIYWSNHHHLLHAVQKIDGPVLWANLHLLFWLSLIPFTTAWMGEHVFASGPVALYGVDLLLAAVAYYILVHTLISRHNENRLLAKAIGSDFKGRISIVFYVAAVVLAFAHPWASIALYVTVALIWLVPDQRIEKKLES